MQNWIVEVMNNFGYAGIIALIALENIFPPIPSEVVLTFGGFMTTFTSLSPLGVILASTVGSLLGALILYGIGRIVPVRRLIRLIEGRIGRMLHLKPKDVYKARNWFVNKGKSTVLFGRCIPVVRSLISIPAGMAKMKLIVFIPFTAIGSLAWNGTLVYLGVITGSSWEKVLVNFDLYLTTIIITLTLIAGGIFLFTKKRFL